jgi:hypothetical protein
MRKCRRRIATRCLKITHMAFSSTVKASELKNIMVTTSTPADHRSRCSRKCADLGDDGLRLSRHQPVQVAADGGQQLILAMMCDKATTTSISSGTIDSSA